MKQPGNVQFRAREGAAPRGAGVVAPLIPERAREPLRDRTHERPVDA